MHLWQAKYLSFMHHAQVHFCTRLIVVPLTTFHRLSEVIGDPQGELTFMFHVARCGSTLLTQVKQWYYTDINCGRICEIEICMYRVGQKLHAAFFAITLPTVNRL